MPKPNMKKLFTGRGKTRPIPRVVDSSDRREIKRVSIAQTPRTSAVRGYDGPRASAPAVFGRKAGGSARTSAGTYNPPSVNDNI